MPSFDLERALEFDLSRLRVPADSPSIEATALSLRQVLLHDSSRFAVLFDAFFDSFQRAFPPEEALEKEDILAALKDMEDLSYDIIVICGPDGQLRGGAITYVLPLTNEGGETPFRGKERTQVQVGYIPYLFVEEDFRRQGFGRVLDYCVEQHASKFGASMQCLENIDHDRVFWPEYLSTLMSETEFYGDFTPLSRSMAWERMGYQKVDTYYNCDGYESPYMMLVRFHDGKHSEIDASLFLAIVRTNSEKWNPMYADGDLHLDIRMRVGSKKHLPLIAPTEPLTCVKNREPGSPAPIPTHYPSVEELMDDRED